MRTRVLPIVFLARNAKYCGFQWHSLKSRAHAVRGFFYPTCARARLPILIVNNTIINIIIVTNNLEKI